MEFRFGTFVRDVGRTDCPWCYGLLSEIGSEEPDELVIDLISSNIGRCKSTLLVRE